MGEEGGANHPNGSPVVALEHFVMIRPLLIIGQALR